MKKMKKAILVAFISPVLAAGCSTTSNKESEVGRNLTPINQFFKSFAFSQCDEEITIDNYESILSKRRSGVYGNPLNADCVPISFNSPETDAFYKDIVESAEDKDAARRIIDHVLKQGFDSKDDMAVTKIPMSDGRLAQLVKYTGKKIKNKTKNMLSRGGELSLHLDEFLFLHELFHLSDMNYDKSIIQNKRETNSDIASIIVISSKYNMSLERTVEMTKELRRFRIDESKGQRGRSHTDHYDCDMMGKFLNYLHELSVTGINLERVSTLKDAERVAHRVALKINKKDRTQNYTFNYYWNKGMGIAENEKPRRSFNEIVAMAKKEPLKEKDSNYKNEDYYEPSM